MIKKGKIKSGFSSGTQNSFSLLNITNGSVVPPRHESVICQTGFVSLNTQLLMEPAVFINCPELLSATSTKRHKGCLKAVT